MPPTIVNPRQVLKTRVTAKNAKARQRQIHDKSQHFTARNQDNTSSSEPFSYHMNINPKDTT